MIDMHCHILFGIDDGAENINDSMDLIKEEVGKGVKHIICTPHFRYNREYTKEKVFKNFELLKEVTQAKRIEVNLYLGNELYLGSDFYKVLESDEYYSLAGSKYLLVEFNYSSTPQNIADTCYEVKIKGYTPIIAHVERYSQLYNNINSIKELINEGALLQVNASTIINKENKDSYKFAALLLRNRLASFVASDVHNISSRGFYLKEAYEKVKKLYGSSYADIIFFKNQLKIISNDNITFPKFETNEESSRRTIFSRFLKS